MSKGKLSMLGFCIEAAGVLVVVGAILLCAMMPLRRCEFFCRSVMVRMNAVWRYLRARLRLRGTRLQWLRLTPAFLAELYVANFRWGSLWVAAQLPFRSPSAAVIALL